MYVGSGDKHLYGVNAATGELLWRYETGERVLSSPTVAGSFVYVGSPDNNLYALQASPPR